MDALVAELKVKLERWNVRTSAEVRSRMAEIIARADEDTLDLGRSRAVEQETLDLLDDEPSRR